jgi:hypothetical protein
MLFEKLSDGTWRLVSDEDQEMEQDFSIIDDVRAMMAASSWTKV